MILGILTIIGCGNSAGNGGNGTPSTSNQPPGGGTTTTPAATNEVVIKSSSFQPSEITVAAGDTVTWTNEDSATHTVTGDKTVAGDDFESGNLGNGKTFSHTFSQAGTYPYHCSIHTNMKGTVIVE